MSYIVRNNKVIAKTEKEYSSQTVSFSYHTVKEEIDMSRELNLVNALSAKLSNASDLEKKWQKSGMLMAKEINPAEFFVD